MNQHVTLTYEERARANAKAIRGRLYGKPKVVNVIREVLAPKVEPVIELAPAEVTVAAHRYDAHVIDFRRWQKEIINGAAQPIRAYIKKRAVELLRTYDDVISRSRKHIDVVPRHLTIWEVKTYIRPDLSLPAIGRIYGLDHTSALNACQRIQKIVDDGKLDEFIAKHMVLVRKGPRWK
ncbi:MAG: helix-turn-helix domain-containing protein [Agrobacterium cavarae]|uniref:helix-turn-helix domain-containing protein n=1 Tax=Agrobacterium cavarae TaxID=2528239 RepID=UPI0031AADEA7